MRFSFSYFFEHAQKSKEFTLMFIGMFFIVNFITYVLYRIASKKCWQEKFWFGYLLVETLYIPLISFGWCFVLYIVFPRNIPSFPFTMQEIPIEELKSLSIWGLCIGFAGFFVRTVKELIFWDPLGKHQAKKSIVKIVAHTFYAFLVCLFLFRSLRTFSGTYMDYFKTAGAGFLLWSFVIILACSIYLFVKDYMIFFEREGSFAAYAILNSTSWPTILLLIGITSIYSIRSMGINTIGEKIGLYYGDVVILCMIWSSFRLTSLLEKQFLLGRFTNVMPNKTIVQGTGNFARVMLGLITLLICMSKLGGGVDKVLTTVAGSSLVIGIAGRDVIANYLSGLVIYFEGQLRVGDWIYSTDKKIEGIIEYIGLRTTCIRTFDKRLLYVPNSFFSAGSIVNASRMTHRRIVQNIPVGWITKIEVLERIIQDIRVVVYNHPGIDKTQPLMVHFVGFGTAGLEIKIYALTRTKNWHTSLNVQENILKEVKRIIEKNAGAPPLQLVSLEKEKAHHY